jgi:DNA-directed RNA polymerase specialized sigma24 family protein
MSESVTQLLGAWRAGSREALDRLTPLVYDELRRLARRYMSSERRGHTLQATELVNQAFVRLVDHGRALAGSRALLRGGRPSHAPHPRRPCKGAPARQARRRRHDDLHRGSRRGERDPDPDLIGLDEALTRLAKLDERKSNIVELHYFGGLTYDEIAEALSISAATVARELNFAKSWLYKELANPSAES